MRQIDIVETRHGASLHQELLQTFIESVLDSATFLDSEQTAI
jgi:hypothetical protein